MASSRRRSAPWAAAWNFAAAPASTVETFRLPSAAASTESAVSAFAASAGSMSARSMPCAIRRAVSTRMTVRAASSSRIRPRNRYHAERDGAARPREARCGSTSAR